MQLTDADYRNGVAYLGVLADADAIADVQTALIRFGDQVFKEFPLRKICFDVVSDQQELRVAIKDLMKLAGCLSHHQRCGSDYLDVEMYEWWAPPDA